MEKAPANTNRGASLQKGNTIVAASTTENQEVFLEISKYFSPSGNGAREVEA